jgi:hypothetical protein
MGMKSPFLLKKGNPFLKLPMQIKLTSKGLVKGAWHVALAMSFFNKVNVNSHRILFINKIFILIPFFNFCSDLYQSLDDPTDEEYDMLDLAFGLTET